MNSLNKKLKSNKNNNNCNFSKELIDDLMKNYNPANPEELIGKNGLLNQLKKALIEKAMNTEMDMHLGYSKNDAIGRNNNLNELRDSNNYRNGYSSKNIITDNNEKISISTPRDRNGDFEPIIIPKHERRFSGFDDKIISMYGRGMTISEIQGHLKDIYQVDVSNEFISNITDAVIEEVEIWQNRPIDKTYPVIFLDAIHIKAKEDNRIINKAVYLALAINMEGRKEILGFWVGKNEGAKFWMGILSELKNRGLEDVFIFCCDGLKGLPDAINSVFPQSQIQLCIVHMVRNSLKFVPYKDRKKVADDLKNIYNAVNCENAEKELNIFKENWDNKYPTISDIWKRNWNEIIPFLAYPPEIRKAIYTTNAIESINFTIRKIIKNKQLFPNDNSIKKILYLTLNNISKKWSMPIANWTGALNQFAIIFTDRFPENF